MQIRYIPATTSLTAGAVTSIISIINKFEVVYSLKILLAVLFLFYILGIIAQKIIFAVVKSNKKVSENAEETNENEENEIMENKLEGQIEDEKEEA